MDLKKKIGAFFTLTRRANSGFTLVELIVVIAILTILAGVAVPAYSGYVEQANKQADMTLVSGIQKALTVAYYRDGFSGAAAVVLTADGAYSANDGEVLDTGFVETAMTAAYGSGWRNSLSLSYGSWGNGAQTAKEVVAHFASGEYDEALEAVYNGSVVPCFAEDVDELFVVIKDTAVNIGGKMEQSGAALVQEAASKTVGSDLTAAQFANKWASSTWDNYLMNGTGESYGENAGKLEGNALDMAVANAAVIKARNTSLATYLRNAGYGEGYDIISNYVYDGTSVPKDVAVAVVGGGDNTMATKLMEAYGSRYTDAATVIFAYFGMTYDEEADDFVSTGATPPAYTDGLAYYAMMDTVNTVNPDNADDETYWEDMASAVNLYGAIATGQTTLADLQEMYNNLGAVPENSVVVTIMAVDGRVAISVAPMTASSAQ